MGEILVLNHDPEFLALMHELLSDEGYSVSTWTDLEAALEHARHRRPDLIIVDVQFERPDPNWTIVNLLRQNPAMASVPILVTATREPLLPNDEELHEHSWISTLVKPFDLDVLLEKVQSLLLLESNGRD